MTRACILALLVLLVGCGGEPDPAEQVKETVTSAAEDARAGRWLYLWEKEDD